MSDTIIATSESSRRYITILFSDLCSSVYLADASEPENYAEVLHQLRETTNQVVSKYGGVLNQFYGDGILSVFGLPAVREGDSQRAVEAAIELHTAVKQLSLQSYLPPSFQLRLHSGIDSGTLLVEPGNAQEGKYKLIGDPPNTAARLSAAAGPDEIIVSASTLSGARDFFYTESIAPLTLRGKPKPVPAYRILGRRADVHTRFEASVKRGLTPFVGREQELHTLKQTLRNARRSLQVISIIGDAGLGKTRTIDEFLRRNDAVGSRVLRGYCEQNQSGIPLQPFVQMLRQIFADDTADVRALSAQTLVLRLQELGSGLAVHLPEFLQMLALDSAAAGSSVNPTGHNKVGALIRLLTTLASHEPLIVFIDDWQWADDASRQLFSRLLQAASDKPILLLTAARELDPSDPARTGTLLPIAPFSETDSERTIAALLPRGLAVSIMRKIHERSGGNALFIEELCQSPGSVNVPATLQGLIEERVGHLPPALAELVRTAAVIGNVFPAWLLEQVSGYSEDDEVVRELASNDLIYAGDTRGMLRFKHGITRDVVYKRVHLHQRQALHLRIASILQQQDAQTRYRQSDSKDDNKELFETLAYHYAGGGDHLQAIRYSQLAGEKAMEVSSLDRARQQFRVALMALERLDQTEKTHLRWLEISNRWALACTYSPTRDQLNLLERTIEHAEVLDNVAGKAHAHYWIGWINYALGEQAESIRNYEKALRMARTIDDDKLATQLLATIGQSHAAACHYSEALTYIDQALEIKRRYPSKSGPPVGSAYAMASKALVLADMGDFRGAHQQMAQALAAVKGAEQAIEGSILSLYCAIYLWQGEWSKAIECARQAQTIAERYSLPYVFTMSQALESYARWILWGTPEALATLQQASEWLEAQEMCLYISFNHGWLADAMAAAGKDTDARRYGMLALDRAHKQDRAGEAMAYRALAKLAARNPDLQLQPPDYYLDCALQCAEARSSRHEMAVTALHRAQLYLSTDRKEQAVVLIDQARTAFTDMQMSWHLEQAQRLKWQLR